MIFADPWCAASPTRFEKGLVVRHMSLCVGLCQNTPCGQSSCGHRKNHLRVAILPYCVSFSCLNMLWCAGEAEERFASFLVEAEELHNIVGGLAGPDGESLVERACTIIDKYQEQPQLLDPHLEAFVTPLVALVNAPEEARTGSGVWGAPIEIVHRACRLLYVLAKVRGFKTVVKFFAPNVADLEPCLELLAGQDPSADAERWEVPFPAKPFSHASAGVAERTSDQVRYVLLLWLSMLVIVPFALASVDSSTCAADGASRRGLIERIVDTCTTCLGEAAKTRDAAAYVLAQLLTRPDLDAGPLVSFLRWACTQLAESVERRN
jgi:hypothetical protein